jgi:hypothetical protein
VPDGARDHATQQQGDGDAVVLSSGEDAGTI